MAGRRGMGALGFQFVSADAAQAWVHAYYNAYVHELDKLTEYATNPNIAVVSGFMCCATDEEALRKADGWTFFQFALRFYNTHGPVEPGTISLWDEYQKWRQTPKGQEQRRTGLVGSPETIRNRLRKFEASNVDQVILLNQAGKNRHEDICESLELFARELMPEFHGRESEHQEWKQGVLAGEIELESIDTDPHNFRSLQARSSKKPEAASAG
jgi:alkanesulfonate monooxygenase SsuD/methylene tetrahydromethanopterin reductase-like flavin-dependent oxidoreductase (luciferase family)